MNAWHIATLLAASGTMICFGGAIPLYFRKGTDSPVGRYVMLGCIGACGVFQASALVVSGNIDIGWRVAGLCLFAFAHMLFWSAVFSHGGDRPQVAFTTDPPRRLVESGAYRSIRHPFYLAYTVAWLAGVVATGSPWSVPTVLIMFFVYRSAALSEEKGFLCSEFGVKYKEYQRRTGMFLPRFVTILHFGRGPRLSLPSKISPPAARLDRQ